MGWKYILSLDFLCAGKWLGVASSLASGLIGVKQNRSLNNILDI